MVVGPWCGWAPIVTPSWDGLLFELVRDDLEHSADCGSEGPYRDHGDKRNERRQYGVLDEILAVGTAKQFKEQRLGSAFAAYQRRCLTYPFLNLDILRSPVRRAGNRQRGVQSECR